MEKGFELKNNHGSVLGLAIIIVVVILILISSIIPLLQYNSFQTNSLIWRDHLHRLANEGYVNSLAQINVDPGLHGFDTSEKHKWEVNGSTWGVYSSAAILVKELPGDVKDIPQFKNSVYLVTTATLTSPSVPPPSPYKIDDVCTTG